MYGVSVEAVLTRGNVCWDAERCGSQHIFLHLSPHPPHSSDTSSHTHPTPLPTLTNTSPPHSPDTSLQTFPHSPPTSQHYLTLPHTPHTFPLPPPTLSHTHFLTSSQPPRLLQHFPMLPYFIIYPMSKFLTFLIFCQISLTIKYTRNSS